VKEHKSGCELAQGVYPGQKGKKSKKTVENSVGKRKKVLGQTERIFKNSTVQQQGREKFLPLRST